MAARHRYSIAFGMGMKSNGPGNKYPYAESCTRLTEDRYVLRLLHVCASSRNHTRLYRYCVQNGYANELDIAFSILQFSPITKQSPTRQQGTTLYAVETIGRILLRHGSLNTSVRPPSS